MKQLLLIMMMYLTASGGWRFYDDGVPVQITKEHELHYEIDTVIATHWHKSGDKFYVITKDNIELWVDNIIQISEEAK